MLPLRIARECLDAVRVLGNGSARSVARRFGWTTALSVAGGALASLAPLALKEVVDLLHALVEPTVASSADSGKIGATSPLLLIVAFAATYLGCHGLARLLAELRPLLMSAAEQHLYGRLRTRYFEHLLALPLAFHLSRRAGATMQDLQQANAGYQIILFHGVNSIVPVLVEALGVMLVLLGLRQAGLSATIALTALAYLLVMSRGMPDLRLAATAVTEGSADVQAMLAEGLSQIEPIKMFGAESHTVTRFAEASLALQYSWRALQRLRMRRGSAMVAVFAASTTASLILSTRAVLDGSLSVGGFVLANLYMMQVIRPLEALSGAVRDVGQALAFVRPLLELMNVASNDPGAHDPGSGSPANRRATAGSDPIRPRTTLQPQTQQRDTLGRAPPIAFRGVHLVFDDRQPVLRGLNLDIVAGRSTAIVGASGCGKSSLVRLLLRLQEPQGGVILLGGIPLQKFPVDRLRAMVAVVPQDVVLFHGTLARNIAFGNDQATPSDIERAAQLAGLCEFIKSLPQGYGTVIGERGLKLSGGERQRIAIARAILRKPWIYVFDEATSMLDTVTEAAILGNLRDIASGRTTITIAHRLSAIQHADHIAVMGDGRIVEQGTHAQLLDRGGAYAAMWQAQQTP